MEACEYLLEVGAHTGSAPTVLRFSSHGLATRPTESPANTVYDRRIADPGTMDLAMFSPGRTLGSPSCDVGEAELVNVDGWLDAIFDHGVDGRELVIKRLANNRDSYASATTIIRATMAGIDAPDAYNGVRIHLRDRLLDLDVELQQNRYLGTTNGAAATADGDIDLKGVKKPLNYGLTFCVVPICVNRFDHIYQVHDGAVFAIAAFDGGVDLTNVGDYATLAALWAADLSPGTYATCLALGLFRLGHITDDVLCCNVVEGATETDRRAGSIARRMLAKIGIEGAAIDAASFTALDVAAPFAVGAYFDSDTTAIAAIGEILKSVQAWLLPTTLGVLRVGRFTGLGTPSSAVIEANILEQGTSISRGLSQDTENGLPAWRVVVRYGRCYRPHSISEIAPCVIDETANPFPGFVAQEWREATAEDASVKTKHPLARELVIETALTSEADALAEAARYLALYKVRRDVLQVAVSWQTAADTPLGSTTTLTLPRLGYEAGKPMVIIGRLEQPSTDQVTLTLWG